MTSTSNPVKSTQSSRNCMSVSGNPVGSSTNVPAFLTKLWKLVEDPNYDHLIHWSENGKSFTIRNQAQFAKELLPLYFKHNNMASFIRQLNMYGFRKLTNIENSGLRSERDDIEFYHPHFVKNQESSLEFIKRKIKAPLQVSSGKELDENRIKNYDLNTILLDVKAIKGKQDSVDNLLLKMQKENEVLWREIAILRQKHQKQQHIVEKLIHFLLSLVHQRGIGVKRKSPLMIGLSEGHVTEGDANGCKRMAKEARDIQDSLSPLIFDVSDDILEAELEANASICPIINTAELSPFTISGGDNTDSNLAAASANAGIINTTELSPLTISAATKENLESNLPLASASAAIINTNDLSPLRVPTDDNPDSNILLSSTSTNSKIISAAELSPFTMSTEDNADSNLHMPTTNTGIINTAGLSPLTRNDNAGSNLLLSSTTAAIEDAHNDVESLLSLFNSDSNSILFQEDEFADLNSLQMTIKESP